MRGKIYKITPHECCEFYIGSTFDMEQRERRHIQSAKTEKRKLYEKIRECGGFDMEVLYEYECADEIELCVEEQRCIDELQPSLNMIRAYNSDEYNIEYQKQYQSKYRETNKDALNEKAKQYYITNKEARMEYKKQYQIINKEAISQRKRQRYNARKLLI